MLYYKYSDLPEKTNMVKKVYKLPVKPSGHNVQTVLTEMDVHSVPVQETGFEAMSAAVSVTEQIDTDQTDDHEKIPCQQIYCIFQNYTNTFLPPDRFRSYLMEATRIPGVVEISVSTRPDCVSAEYLDIMRDIRAMTGIQMNVELGLQTANYHTLQMIDRGHGLAEFIDAHFI